MSVRKTAVWMLACCSFWSCAESGKDLPSGATEASQADDGAPPAGVFAIQQEDLARKTDAIKLSGTITVKDYSAGLIQVDVTRPVEGNVPPQGVPPITVARFKSPGPYELFLPAGTEAVTLSMFLDLKGNGPDAEDPKAVYEPNPLKIGGASVAGIDLVIEKLTADLPPGQPAGDGQSGAASGEAAPAAGADGQSLPAGGTTSTAPAGAVAAPGTQPEAAPAAAADPNKAAKPPPDTLETLKARDAGASPPGAGSAPGAVPPTSSKQVIDVLDAQLDGAPRVAK